MQKGFTLVEVIIVIMIFSLLGLIWIGTVLQGQKKAELIYKQYGLECDWYNIRACEEMLPYKVGKQQTYNINGLK